MFLEADQVGQAFDNLAGLRDDVLTVLLPTHGFPEESLQQIRKGDQVGLIGARLKTLIAGERESMQERNVTLPTSKTSANIADSDAMDEVE